MKERILNSGDLVKLKTHEKEWVGIALESYNPEIILLKLNSGYNVGIKESEVLNLEVLEEAKKIEKKEFLFQKKEGLRNVAIIMTGGTISSRLDPKTGGVIATETEEILKIAPGINEICNIVKIAKPFTKFSEDMSYKDWKKIAEAAEKFLNDKDIDGLIITHGTDFLHYTSSALSFFLKDLNKPVAITGSQRSIDRGSTDASLNLICSARYAVSDIAEVALISHETTNDTTCIAIEGTSARKMHTSARDAFKSINSTPLARISVDSFEILKTFKARDKDKKVSLDDSFEEKIATIKITPGSDPEILDFYQSKGYKGIILEVSGIGQVPGKNSKENWLPKIKKAINNGLVICATAQTIFGRLNPKVYSSGRELEKTGIIFLEDMTSETAFVKLGFVLGHKNWNKEQKMLESLNEEVSS